MKIAVVSRDNSKTLKLFLTKAGFILSKHPEVVFCVGGDGTFLIAEQKYPSIPKVLIRDKSICMNCGHHTIDVIIQNLKTKQYNVKTIYKLKARYKNKEFYCTNDFIIRNKVPYMALRFLVILNGKRQEIIGDGIVASTSFGSTGYFKSITKKSFTQKMGIAFSNPTKPQLPIITDTPFTIHITRGPAEFTCDNNRKVITLHNNDQVTIMPCGLKAKIIEFSK